MKTMMLLLALALAGPAPASAQASPDLDRLHAALALSGDQEAAWARFRQAMPSPARTEQRRRAAAQLLPGLTAPRRIDLIIAETAQELAELQRQAAALKQFYAVLRPEQQRLFDAQTLPTPPNDD